MLQRFLALWHLSLIFGLPILQGQTILEPGDLAVLGVNTNTFLCSGVSGADEVSFVCFQDLETNTTIDITDNGWERINPGLWGDTEGMIRLTRTGGPVAAGTVITIQFLNGGYNVLSPDNNWSITDLNPPVPPLTINLNSMGDQLYFMQGGNWNNPPGNHDATYDGTILFGFNTLAVWAADGTTQQSNLHPQVIPCFHMEPTSGVTDYIKYTNPLSAATQLDWINRIRNAANWTSYPDCATYQSAPPDYAAGYVLPLNSSGISVNCSICNECAPFDETLVFDLPASGGPFDVTYSDGTNTYTLNGVNDGITAIHTITADVDFYLVSVTDPNGCPVYSNFEGEANITVVPIPDAGLDNSFYICPDAMPFDLTDSLSGTPDPGGIWTPPLNSGTNIYNTALDGEGSFVYTVSGGLCPDATATATVSFVDLSTSTVEVSCFDNDTPNDDTDDVIFILFTPIGEYLGTQYNVTVTQGSVFPPSSTYGITTVFQMQPGSAGAGNFIFIVQDQAAPFCSFNFVINDPGPCSNSCADAPTVSIDGCGDICVGNCPGEPALLSFNISGGEEPFELEMSASFPPFPAFDFTIPGLTLNEEINICIEGLLPGYDPGTNTLTLPEAFAGLSGSVTVLGITDNAGCPGTVSAMNSISLNILENPGAADPNIAICEDLAINYDLTQWNSTVNPNATISWFDGDPAGGGTPFPNPSNTDLTMVNDLWALADDGNCTSTVQVTLDIIPEPPAIDPAPNICGSEAAAFNLTTLDQEVNPTAVITWFNGDPLTGGTIIPDPTNTDLTFMQDIFALVIEEPCSTAIQISYFLLPDPELNPISLMMCATSAQSYDLSQHDTEVSSSLPVTWYVGEPTQGGMLITDPAMADISSLNYVWAFVDDGICTNSVEIPIEILEWPEIQQVFIEVCSAESDQIDLTQFSNTVNGLFPVGWYEGDPENGGTLIAIPEDVNLNQLSSLWVLVNDGACISTAEIGFNILPSPELDLSEMIGICNGDSIDLNEIQITDLNGSGSQITFHNSFPPWAGNTIDPPVVTPATSTTIYALATAGECTDTLPIPIQVNALPTFQVFALPCDLSNNTYTIVFQTNAEIIVSSAGIVFNNMAGQDSIIDVPDGITPFLILTSADGCQDTITVQAPDCDCPVIPLPDPFQDTVSICNDEAIPAISVTVEEGLIANWYDQILGGMLLLEDNTTYKPNTSITTTFYVEAVDTTNNCASPRVPVTLEVFQVPVLQMLDDPELCNGDSLNLSTYIPLVINGVSGTGQWFELPAMQPVSGHVPAVEGAEYIYFFTALVGDCQAGDTIMIQTVEKPDFDLLDIHCIDSTFTYEVLLKTDATNITTGSGTITQINASDSFLLSGVILNTDVVLTLSGNVIDCDTSITITAPDCACPPLLNAESIALCSDPGTIDLEIFQNGSVDGFWQFISTPEGSQASINSGSLFDGSNAKGGLYILKFTSDIPLGECDDSAFFDLHLVTPTMVTLPSDTVHCAYNQFSFVNLAAGVDGSHVLLDWSSNGDGELNDTTENPSWYEIGVQDILNTGVTITLVGSDEFNICPNDTAQVAIEIDTSAFINILYPDLWFLCDTMEMPFDLNDLIFSGEEKGTWSYAGPLDPSEVTLIDGSKFIPADLDYGGHRFQFTTNTASGICEDQVHTVYPSIDDCSCSLQVMASFDTLTLCEGDVLELTGSVSGEVGNVMTYWTFNTDTFPGNFVNASSPGFYIFHAEDESNCLQNDTVTVSEYEEVQAFISAFDPTCPGEADGVIVIDHIVAGQGPLFISLNNSDFEEVTALPYSFSGMPAGVQQFIVMDGFGCTTTYDIILEDPEEGSVSLGPDRLIHLGDNIKLDPVLNFMPDSFSWVTNPMMQIESLNGHVIYPEEDLIIELHAFDENGCLYSDDLFVSVVRTTSVYVPNIFSPNDDGINDVFRPFFDDQAGRVLTFQLYNRWDGLVFGRNDMLPNDPGLGWNGKINNEDAQPGVYVYRLILMNEDGKEVHLNGDFSLVR